MLPTILPGSLVITKKAPQYQIDDIVSFTQEEEGAKRVVVHRIIDQTDMGFVIKGDNNPKKDPGYPHYEDINGKVIFATPYFGDMISLLRNPVLLFASSIGITLIQFAQKRRKTKKEKIRRIRLGLPINDLKEQKKPQTPDYTPFFAAIGINVITYIILQVSLGYNLHPKGDMITGFLFTRLSDSFASTVAFALYLIFIFGLYFAAKAHEKKLLKSTVVSNRKSKTMQMLVGKNFNPILTIAQFLWVVFIIISIFHIITIGSDLIETISCDPSKELC